MHQKDPWPSSKTLACRIQCESGSDGLDMLDCLSVADGACRCASMPKKVTRTREPLWGPSPDLFWGVCFEGHDQVRRGSFLRGGVSGGKAMKKLGRFRHLPSSSTACL